jgi:hypothetical protein
MVRKLLLAGVATAALLYGSHAEAQVGNCTTIDGPCSSFLEQQLSYLLQGLQKIDEDTTAFQEVAAQLPLVSNAFYDLTADVGALQGYIYTANMLVGLTGQIITNISSQGGYPVSGLNNWHQQFTNESLAVGKAMNVCGQVINFLTDIIDDAKIMTSLVNQVIAAVGREKSLQTISSQLSEEKQEIQKIQGGANGCRQSSATFQAAKQDHQYLTQTVGDHDLEITEVTQCAAVSALGFTPAPASCN